MIDSNAFSGDTTQRQPETRQLPIAQQLRRYASQGYVFHGSTSPNITKLEPRPATDVDTTKAFNNDTAVFATPSPAASIIFACMSLDNAPGGIRNGNWSVGSENGRKIVARIPRKWQQYVTPNTGYVYVLDGSTFSGEDDIKDGWQVKSKQSVNPTAIIKVSFSDFEQLGGLVIWKDDD